MADIDTTTRCIDDGSRRWSEPVRIGEIVLEILTAIEACGMKAVGQAQSRTTTHSPWRKAG